jgi:hypothetical protein
MIVAGASMTFFIVGAGLIVVGVLSFWRQSRTASCPRHSRLAGGVAITLACVCVLAGIGLLAFAVGRQDTNRLFSTVVTGLKHWVGIKEPSPYTPPTLPQAEAEQVVDRLIGLAT